MDIQAYRISRLLLGVSMNISVFVSIASTFAIESPQVLYNYLKMSVDMVCMLTEPTTFHPSVSPAGRGVTGIAQQPLVKAAVGTQLVVLSC